MPKPLSESERLIIKQRLLAEAKYCLEQYGVKKTTVDEIVHRARIPKGTFYLFYESKELLLFEVFLALHDEYQEKLLRQITDIQTRLTPETLTDIFFSLYKTMDGSPLLRLMTNGEIELLFRKLPPDIVREHAEKDDFRVEELISMVPQMKAEKIQVFSAALRGIFITLLNKSEIGAEVYDEALRVMIRGVVIQMFEGEK